MSQKRQDIIETAFRLFSENGFYATGIDQIIAESQTSKKTLYTHFSSKNDLVVAVMKYYREHFFAELNAHVLSLNLEPYNKLIKLFEVAHSWYASKKFNGCLAISAMNEFGNKDQDIADSCLAFKETERGVLLEILKDMRLENVNQIADRLFLILEGITVTAHIGSMEPSYDDIRELINKVCPLYNIG